MTKLIKLSVLRVQAHTAQGLRTETGTDPVPTLWCYSVIRYVCHTSITDYNGCRVLRSVMEEVRAAWF